MKYVISNTVIAILFALSIICNIWLFTTKPITTIDTKIIHDTTVIVKDSIQYHTKIKNIIFHDTIVQTIVNTDTVYVPIQIPITYKTYTDKIFNDNIEYDVTINYSGYKSEIEDVTIYSNYVKQDVKNITPKPWRQTVSLGIQVGYGIQLTPYNTMYSFGPYVGIGIQYGWGYTW